MILKRVGFIILIIQALLLAGCSMKTHKNYAFTEPRISLVDSTVYGKLRGSMLNVDDKTSVYQAPYELLIWFVSDNVNAEQGCSVNISSIVFKNIENNETVAIPETASALFRAKEKDIFSATVIIKNVNIAYADHEMQFVYSFSNRCGVAASSTVKIIFQKDYSERNIYFWDTLMGV